MTLSLVDPELVEVLSHRRELDERVGVLSAQIHALEAELVETLADFDEAGGWQGGGWRSFAHWVSMRTKFAPRDAQRLVSVAAQVDALPTLLADARSGQVSLGVLASAARVVTPENEERVADVVRVCTPAQAQRVLGTYRVVRDHPGESEVLPPESESDLWWRNWIDDRGRYRVDGALDKVTGELLEQARLATLAELERDGKRACEPSSSGAAEAGDSDSAQPRRPSAPEVIAALASTVVEHASSAGVRDRGGERFAVQIVADLETLASALGIELDRDRPVRIGARAYLPRTGAHLSNSELVRMVCEGTVQLLIEDGGQALWLGTETRLFSRQQRRALRHRAGGGTPCCEFPGCTITRFVEAHHVLGVHDDDGPTDLENGVLLCGFHHRELHRRGWRIVRNGTLLTFYDGAKCLGSSGVPGPVAGPGSDATVLPFQTKPPDPPPGIGPDSPRSGGHGEPLTRWGLDVLLQHLLDAA